MTERGQGQTEGEMDKQEEEMDQTTKEEELQEEEEDATATTEPALDKIAEIVGSWAFPHIFQS